MTLVRWSPFREVLSIQNEMNRFVDDLLRNRPESGETGLWPAADVCETEKNYEIHVELPGMDMKDIKVHFTNDLLVVRGEKKQEQEDKDRNWRAIERSYGSFERSFRFPVPVQSDKVKAKYQNGILTIQIPKAEEVTPREIQIEG